MPVVKKCFYCAAAAVLLTVNEARADGFVTPWIGSNIASSSDEGSTTFGVTMGYMAAGVFGFEGDLAYAPDFGSAGPGEASAITAMGNLIAGVPVGGTDGAGIRPFVSAGLGLLRTHVEGATAVDFSRTSHQFGYELGAGMMGFFNEHFGLRGDVRYLRALDDTDRGQGIDLESGRLHFWRFSGGVTFR